MFLRYLDASREEGISLNVTQDVRLGVWSISITTCSHSSLEANSPSILISYQSFARPNHGATRSTPHTRFVLNCIARSTSRTPRSDQPRCGRWIP